MKTHSTLLASSAAAVLAIAGALAFNGRVEIAPAPVTSPEIVVIEPGVLSYALPGEYLAGERVVDAPVRELDFKRSFDMMKYQVSVADYALCVAQNICKQADGIFLSDDRPVTGVDFADATDYAKWLSKQTGEYWRLPTDEEWTYAAAERYQEQALGVAEDDGANPAARWLARYRNEAANSAPDSEVKPLGYFGVNSKGVADMSANVWDWTSTCYSRASVEPDGKLGKGVKNCGVRVASGKHRAYMSFFIRSGKSGGCAAGMAPDNLGIRLVREKLTFFAKLNAMLQPAG
ncbi:MULTISPECIES: SUMF1/EgtB/PvdO family nonheme iron enzyme [Mesorhizobium]|uniref:Formylglycine-generating enzyme family protein n=1 Tax=Mesorhizobium denitrificans TaxID=2294114 RepID=A0A371XK15_9HYPH|nr:MULTISPECIES: SUMF1/EgtB/PvdO family nonheme iron enzyme [Mesorhizobium]RFC69384.1 formylglycine-generating enzyme family protein [Mesorhizobium denitrificans]